MTRLQEAEHIRQRDIAAAGELRRRGEPLAALRMMYRSVEHQAEILGHRTLGKSQWDLGDPDDKLTRALDVSDARRSQTSRHRGKRRLIGKAS